MKQYASLFYEQHFFIKNRHLFALIKWDVPEINSNTANSPRISSVRVKAQNFLRY